MLVSDRDREHFRRVAEAKAAEDQERELEELGRPAIERILEGLALGEQARSTPAIERALDERALGQAELHRRARRLGLAR